MIEKAYELATGHSIRYQADDIRRERTGVHARVTIFCESAILAYSTFNVDRHEDRVRLSNTAWEGLGEDDGHIWPKPDMRHALDIFCRTLWTLHVAGSITVEDVAPGEDEAEPEFAIYPYTPMDAGSILFGPRGRGKSAALLIEAVQVDAGIGGVYEVRRPCKVLFLNLERSRESLLRRLRRTNLALGLPATRPLKMINARGRSLTDVAPRALKVIEDGEAEIVYLDSLSRAGVELTKDDTANAAIDILNRFGTWKAIAHEPKDRNAQTASVFGSSQFENAADIVCRLASESRGDELGISVRMTKANDVKPPRPFVFALSFDEWGLTNIRPAMLSEFPDLAGRDKADVADQLYALLLEGRATMSEAAEELDVDRSNIYRAIKGDKRFVKVAKEGTKQYWGVAEQKDWTSRY